MAAPNVQFKPNSFKGAVEITPNDSADLTDPVSALYIGGSGTGGLKVDMASGETVTFAGLTANTVLHIAVKRVYSTGTGVTSIIGLK